MRIFLYPPHAIYGYKQADLNGAKNQTRTLEQNKLLVATPLRESKTAIKEIPLSIVTTEPQLSSYYDNEKLLS